jgi:hypothetical protein
MGKYAEDRPTKLQWKDLWKWEDNGTSKSWFLLLVSLTISSFDQTAAAYINYYLWGHGTDN